MTGQSFLLQHNVNFDAAQAPPSGDFFWLPSSKHRKSARIDSIYSKDFRILLTLGIHGHLYKSIILWLQLAPCSNAVCKYDTFCVGC